jgi:hypothetical protein
MKKLFLTIGIVLGFSLVSQAQEWKAELKKDLVKIEGNKMTSTEFFLLHFENESNVQVKIYAEAPSAGVISRDNFVAITNTLAAMKLLTMFSETGIPNMTNLSELIGKADVEFNYYFTSNGMQMEIKTSEGSDKITMTWEEYFSK